MMYRVFAALIFCALSNHTLAGEVLLPRLKPKLENPNGPAGTFVTQKQNSHSLRRRKQSPSAFPAVPAVGLQTAWPQRKTPAAQNWPGWIWSLMHWLLWARKVAAEHPVPS